MPNDQNIDESKRKEAWIQVEKLILDYQSEVGSAKSQQAAFDLLKCFTPLFNKYIKMLKYNKIDFYDPHIKRFIFTFIDKKTRSKFPKNIKEIRYRFCFITKTYGMLSEDEILSDIYEIFLKMANRYKKQENRNFCAYIYNAFHYEMSRAIKKYTSDISSIAYKSQKLSDNCNFVDFIPEQEEEIETFSLEWINGECSCEFKNLSPLDRKIIIYYYGDDDFPDKKIAEILNIHINTVNQRRRKAVKLILNELKQKELKVIRSRKLYKTPPDK